MQCYVHHAMVVMLRHVAFNCWHCFKRGRSHGVRSYATDVCDIVFIASKIAGIAVFVDVARLVHAHLGLTADVPASCFWLSIASTPEDNGTANRGGTEISVYIQHDY